jgi:peptide/nickel transport system substrate-binding protein
MTEVHRLRTSLLIGAAAIPLLLTAACGSSSSNGSGNGQSGADLRVGSSKDLEETDSVQIRTTVDRMDLGSTVYEPLFVAGPDGRPTPGLAKSAKPSKNFDSWTVTLQSGVKFQNGDPFNAAAVKANFEAIEDPKNASDQAGDYAFIKSIDVLSDTKVRFNLKAPDNDFSADVTDLPLMGDMAARAKMGVKAWQQHPIGTGPYEWSKRIPGDRTVFTRFNGYWRGTPPLSEVQFIIFPEVQTATLALQHGDVDMLDSDLVSPDAMTTLQAQSDLQVLKKPSNTLYHVWLNFGQPRASQYKDVLAFHQGLAHLFNAQEVVPKLIGGYGEYSDQEIAKFQAGYDPSIQPFSYDPALATQLLTQAGFPKGSTLQFDAEHDDPYLCQMATVIQAQFQQAGYKVNINCSSSSSLALGPNYNWDVFFSRSSGRANAAQYFHLRWDKGLAEAKDDKNTFEDDHLQGLIDAIQQAPSEQKAKQLAQAANKYVSQTNVAVIPLFFANNFFAANKKVQGLVLTSTGWNSFLWNDYTKVTLGS